MIYRVMQWLSVAGLLAAFIAMIIHWNCPKMVDEVFVFIPTLIVGFAGGMIAMESKWL